MSLEKRLKRTSIDKLLSECIKLSKDIKKDIRIIKAIKHFRLQEETIERLSKELNQERQARSDNELELLTLRQEVKNQEEKIKNLEKGL